MTRKYRNRAQENTRVVRINLGDYALLRQVATESSVSIREVIHSLIAADRKPSSAQLSMRFPVEDMASSLPVNQVRSIPVNGKLSIPVEISCTREVDHE
jgi:hypothetical protein